jgi:ABC-type transport system substrate-binding protein
MASPAQWEKKLAAVPASVTDKAERSKQAWAAFAADASGTGPFKMAKFVPRERLEVVKNDGYWDRTRPKIDRVVMLPLPEANSRTAALMSGQVDWIEAPAPDALDAIKARGFRSTPTRSRTCAVAAVLRARLALAGQARAPCRQPVRESSRDEAAAGRLMGEATGTVEPGHPWRGTSFQIKYDPAAAKKLMSEAGYSAAKPLTVKVQISASGSGQMQPLPMNEFMQQNLKDCFFDVQFDVIEWNTLYTNWRIGAKDRARTVPMRSTSASPPWTRSLPWCVSSIPRLRRATSTTGASTPSRCLIAKARTTFDPKQRDALLAQLHAKIVDEGALRLGGPRHRPACHLRQGQGRGAAAELVHRHRHHEHGRIGTSAAPQANRRRWRFPLTLLHLTFSAPRCLALFALVPLPDPSPEPP